MKPKLLLRLAAGCMLFFALGHTMGHVSRHNVSDAKAKEVLRQMSENKFDMFGQMRSYDQNYTGMSLNLILTLLAFTILLWVLSNYSNKNPIMVKQLLIPIAFCTIGFAITGFQYFFPLPAITCMVAFLLITIAMLKLKKTN